MWETISNYCSNKLKQQYGIQVFFAYSHTQFSTAFSHRPLKAPLVSAASPTSLPPGQVRKLFQCFFSPVLLGARACELPEG